MTRACEEFLDAHGGEELEEALVSSDAELADKVCSHQTKVCQHMMPSWLGSKMPQAVKKKAKRKAKHVAPK
jgi:hypothetical protein